MGGAVSNTSSARNEDELFAFCIAKAEYERLNYRQRALQDDEDDSPFLRLPPNMTDELIQSRLINVFNMAKQEYHLKFPDECRNPLVILHRYTSMKDDEKESFHNNFIEAVLLREEARSKAAAKNASSAATDYSKSFGGTAEDTKKEKDAAALMRGEGNEGSGGNDADSHSDLLAPPKIDKSSEFFEWEMAFLRKNGVWKRFLGSIGCYLYINVLSKEVLSIRPSAYDEALDPQPTDSANNASEGGDPELLKRINDPANGLKRVKVEDLLAEVERIVSEEKKTPLIIDTSKEQISRTFFSYKGHLEDVSPLSIPFAKSALKRGDLMERCRKTLVRALKTGQTFALYLGEVSIEHADFKKKLCNKTVFPLDTFTNAGLKLLMPESEPRFKAIFREEDMESGQCISREGFKVVVITSLNPYDYEALLSDCIPLGYCLPIYLDA